MKDIPAVVWVCVTVVFLGITTAFVVLSVSGSDATEFRSFLNTAMNFGGLVLGAIGALGGTSAAINAKRAADQTNGPISDIKEVLDVVKSRQVASHNQYEIDQERGGDAHGRQVV